MPPQTWVARFVVDHGRVTEEGACLRTFQRRRLDEPDADLHILAEPAGDKGEELAGQAIEAVGRAFLQDRLSLTGGLLRALRTTHQTLLDWNRRSVPRDQVTTGVGAAVVCAHIVYLAQCGPSVAFLRRGGSLQRLVPVEGGLLPLGEGELEPSLRRFELEPGDILLCPSPRLESILDQRRLEDILARGSEEALPELYLITRDLPSFALFAVTCLEPGDEAPETAVTDVSFELPPADEPLGTASTQPPGLPSESRGATSAELQVASHHDTTAAPSPVAVLAPAATNGSARNGDSAALILPVPAVDISRPVVRLRNNLSLGRSDYARTTGPARRLPFDFAQPRFLALVAAAAIVLFLGAFAVPDLIRENRSEKVAALVQAAQLQFAAANSESDPGRRRDLLEETQRLANEAVRIDGDHPEAVELRRQSADALRGLDAVFDLGPLTTVTTLGRQITGDIAIASVTTAAGSVYMLDSKGGRIIGVPLSGAGPPQVLYQKGETYGGAQAKEPLFMSWQGDNRSGRLLVLDQERKLFELPPGATPAPLPLRRTNTWASIAGIATYDGNLYVLDPKSDQVHRYLPAAQGFDSEPAPVLTGNRELADATGFAVSGDIFIYTKDGSLRRFVSGVETPFGFAGIDRPVKSPTDIVLLGGAGEIYLADSGNKRIVVGGLDGTFKRQLVSSAFTDLRCLSIDAAAGLLYVVVGDALLSAPLVR